MMNRKTTTFAATCALLGASVAFAAESSVNTASVFRLPASAEMGVAAADEGIMVNALLNEFTVSGADAKVFYAPAVLDAEASSVKVNIKYKTGNQQARIKKVQLLEVNTGRVLAESTAEKETNPDPKPTAGVDYTFAVADLQGYLRPGMPLIVAIIAETGEKKDTSTNTVTLTGATQTTEVPTSTLESRYYGLPAGADNTVYVVPAGNRREVLLPVTFADVAQPAMVTVEFKSGGFYGTDINGIALIDPKNGDVLTELKVKDWIDGTKEYSLPLPEANKESYLNRTLVISVKLACSGTVGENKNTQAYIRLANVTRTSTSDVAMPAYGLPAKTRYEESDVWQNGGKQGSFAAPMQVTAGSVGFTVAYTTGSYHIWIDRVELVDTASGRTVALSTERKKTGTNLVAAYAFNGLDRYVGKTLLAFVKTSADANTANSKGDVRYSGAVPCAYVPTYSNGFHIDPPKEIADVPADAAPDATNWTELVAGVTGGDVPMAETPNVALNMTDTRGTFTFNESVTLDTLDMSGTGTVIVPDGVTLSVKNYRVADTVAFEIQKGGTLKLNGTIDAVTGKLAGAGTFQCTLTDDWSNRVIKLGDAFKGTTELLGGKLTLNGDTRIGSKLKVSGGHLQTKAAMTLKADLEIAARDEVQLHCNGDCPLTLDGNLTGTGTLNKLGKTNLTLKGNASDIAGLKLGNIGHLVVAGGARLKLPNVQDSETGGNKPSLVVEQGGILTIGGEVSYAAKGALTLRDGAKIERVRDSALGLNRISELTVGGTVAVTLVEPAAAPLALQPAATGIVSVMNLTGQSGVSADNFRTDDASAKAGWGLYASDLNLQLVNAVGVLPAEEGDPAYAAEAAGEILNEAYGMENPTYSVIAGGVRKPMNAKDVNAAYACFNGHPVTKPAEGEVAVAYNFGVSEMKPVTVDGKAYVVFAATVEGANEDQRLEYSPAVTLEVNETTEGADASAPVSVTEVTGIDGTEPGKSTNPSVRYLRMPMPDDASAHLYRVRVLGSDVELGSVTVVVPSAGVPVQMLVNDGATLLKMQPKSEQTSLSLTLTGAGTQVGQTYRLVADGAAAVMGLAAEAEPTVYGTAVMTEGGRVVFENIRVPANTTVRVVAADCSGDVTIRANSWDAAGVTLGKTAAVTRMVAVHPKYDFPEYSEHLTGDAGADAAVAKNHSQYRIPGLASNGKGEVIGVYDIRWLSQDDLGVQGNTKVPGTDRGEWSPMDMGESYSDDHGHSWKPPVVGYDAPNTYDPKTGARSAQASDTNKPWICDVGDPCIVYVPGTAADDPGYYLAMGITGGGLASAGGANKNNGLLLMKRPAGPDGKWTRAFGEDNLAFKTHVFEAMYRAGVREDDSVLKNVANATDVGNQTRGILQGPGHAMVTAVGRDDMPAGTVVFPMQWFWNTNQDNWPARSYAFAIYLKPGSEQWEATHLSHDRSKDEPVDLGTQENSIAELDDGTWYMIAKKANVGERYHYRSTDFSQWKYLRSTPSQAVQGSIIRLGKKNGVGQYAMAYSTADGRRQLKVFFGSDVVGNDGKHDIAWDMEHPLMVHEGDTDGKSYNSMCLLDGGKTLGFLYEANMHVYFKRIDISDRVDVPAK